MIRSEDDKTGHFRSKSFSADGQRNRKSGARLKTAESS